MGAFVEKANIFISDFSATKSQAQKSNPGLGLSSDELRGVSQGWFPAENTGLAEQVFSGNVSIPKKRWLGAIWYNL